MTDDEGGTVVDEEMRESLLSFAGMVPIFDAPVDEDDNVVDFWVVFFDEFCGFFFVQSAGRVVETDECESFAANIFHENVFVYG